LAPVQSALNTPETALLDATFRAWRGHKRTGWVFAILLARVRLTKSWRLDGYKDFADWGNKVLHIESAGQLNAYAKVGEFVQMRPIDEQERWLAVPLHCADAVLAFARKEPRLALELAEQNTQAHIRAEVKKRLEHADTSPRRTYMFRISKNTRDDFQRAVNVVKCQLGVGGSKWPTDDEVATAIAQTILQAPELTALIPAQYREDVEAGRAQCAICGSHAQLERHHLLPRSMGGVDGPTCWIDSDCHAKVTNYRDGWSWRKLAMKLGHPEIAEHYARIEREEGRNAKEKGRGAHAAQDDAREHVEPDSASPE